MAENLLNEKIFPLTDQDDGISGWTGFRYYEGYTLRAVQKLNIVNYFIEVRSYTECEIGYIDTASKILHYKRDRDKHLYRKGNGYGINYHVVMSFNSYDTVAMVDNLTHWIIPRQWLVDNGAELKMGAFECQKMYGLDELEPFRVGAWLDDDKIQSIDNVPDNPGYTAVRLTNSDLFLICMPVSTFTIYREQVKKVLIPKR